MRHAIEPRIDPHRELKRDFAKELAEMLDKRLSEKAFDRLVIVAPPKALGDLRAALSAQVKPLVYAELDKDLVKIPDGGAAQSPRRGHGDLSPGT